MPSWVRQWLIIIGVTIAVGVTVMFLGNAIDTVSGGGQPNCDEVAVDFWKFTPGCRWEDLSLEQRIEIINKRQQNINRCLSQGKTPQMSGSKENPWVYCY